MVENVIRLIRELDTQIDELKHTAEEDNSKLEEQLKAVENAITELEKTSVTVPDDLFQLRDHFREHRKQITSSKESLQTIKAKLIALLNKFDGVAEAEPEEEIPEQPVEPQEVTETIQQEEIPDFNEEPKEPVEEQEVTETIQQEEVPDFEEEPEEQVEKQEVTETIQQEEVPDFDEEPEEPVESQEVTEPIQQEEVPDFDEEPEKIFDTVPEEEQPEPDLFQKTVSDKKPKNLREILSSSPPSTTGNRIIRINEPETEQPFSPSDETEGSDQSNDTTPSEELRLIMLEILKDNDGKATSNDIRTEMEKRIGSSFTPADLGRLPNGKLTWWRNVQLERERLIEEGILSSEYHQGMWELN